MRNYNNLKKISKDLIVELGEDPNRTGLKETPKRMAKMFLEVFKGYDITELPAVTAFPNNEDGIQYNQIITDQGCFHSYCEHHMALFSGDYYFGYIPNDSVIGLSKIARVVDFYAGRMQVQERLGDNIVTYIENKIKPKGIILVLKASHSCKSIRGVKKEGKMTTSIVRGLFAEDASAKQEFLKLIQL